MDLIKLSSSTFKPTSTIQGFDRLIWTERYQEAGEFTIEQDLTIAAREELAIGGIISHTDTRESMFIEDHEISGDRDKRKLKVTGRSFETFLERRYILLGIGMNVYPTNEPILWEYTSIYKPADVVDELINSCIISGFIPRRQVANVDSQKILRNAGTNQDQILIARDKNIYSEVLNVLKLQDLGLKTIRPTSGSDLLFTIHDGVDLRSSVIFSEHNEELVDTKYFVSNRNLKNYAEVSGYYAAYFTPTSSIPTGLNLRELGVVNTELGFDPTDPDINGKLGNYGRKSLAEHTMINLGEASLTSEIGLSFGITYNIGDIITIRNEFDQNFDMRVTEHTLTFDNKEGLSAFATLSPYEGT